MKSYLATILPLLFVISACSPLKLNAPGPKTETVLVLPVTVVNKAQTRRHAFYYVYKITSEHDQIAPYNAIIKLPLQGDMLIVDSLPPGSYAVTELKFLPIGVGDFSYGNNVQQRFDNFNLEAGKITVFQKSLNLSMYNPTVGRGRETTYAFDMKPVTATQREEILATLAALPNFASWEIQQGRQAVAFAAQKRIKQFIEQAPEPVVATTPDLTGSYIAHIDGNDLYGLDSVGKTTVRIDQAGNKITATFGRSGTIQGYIEANKVLFKWESNKARGQGEWIVSADSSSLSGSWNCLNYNAEGSWNLLRQ